MIDDYAKAKELMRKMQAQLPIPVRPTQALIRLMSQHEMPLTRDQVLTIKSLFYMGDEGGIACDVTVSGKTPMVCSITQVEISLDHPLAREIQAYQRERTRKLAKTERRAGSVFIPPSRKRRR